MRSIFKSTLFIFITLINTGCAEEPIVREKYQSEVLKRFDLRGKVKSLKVTSGFEEPNEYYQYTCRESLRSEPRPELTVINFDENGEILSRRSPYTIYDYNSEGELIRKSFTNVKGEEYGYSEFEYYHSRYYDREYSYSHYHNTYSSKNGNIRIDTITYRPDTSIVIEMGTSNKYYKGPDALSVLIYRNYVINSKGYILEEHGPDVQYSNYHYSYDSNGRLTNRTEYYQGFLMDSINYSYNELAEIIECNNEFNYKKHDDHGNWTLLEISNDVDDQKIEIHRTIEYFSET
ncbi:hypothetical protein NMK71_07435 [Weeksellaceae bacterium KMM 9713]|uniref:Uncharacterized protein n=1 Tax=Profundicola chukchiensis TaxID=2961959 RepID=A0A9X4N0Q1_9FLAO|nr:hypothetical protein [Profundicola chukchiensis]MDG4946241.1 hypothetical protein [Profundicola chukchiensis]